MRRTTTMTTRLWAPVAAIALVVAACTGDADPSPESDTGAVVQPAFDAAPIAYSPTFEGLTYALPRAISSVALVDSPAEMLAEEELELADDPLIRRDLVERGLGPSIISVAQRGTSYTELPLVSTTAVQFKGLPAEDFAEFVPSVYLLATSVTFDQHNLTGAKPARREAVIEGRTVQSSDWGAFDVVWYPHGDVVFIVVAQNPQLLAAALRALPPYGGSS
jgi:hypothetical protein